MLRLKKKRMENIDPATLAYARGRAVTVLRQAGVSEQQVQAVVNDFKAINKKIFEHRKENGV